MIPYSGSIATAPAPGFSAIATNTADVQQAAPIADTASAGRKLQADEVCAVLNPAESHIRVMACQHYYCNMQHEAFVSRFQSCTLHVPRAASPLLFLAVPCSRWKCWTHMRVR